MLFMGKSISYQTLVMVPGAYESATYKALFTLRENESESDLAEIVTGA